MNLFGKIILGIFAFILFISIVCGLGWLATGNDFLLYKYFAPKQEAVRRQVFENTPSYTQGMIQELRNYQIEYISASTNHQAALASVILHQYAPFPDDKLPLDLQSFMQTIRQKQGLQ